MLQNIKIISNTCTEKDIVNIEHIKELTLYEE